MWMDMLKLLVDHSDCYCNRRIRRSVDCSEVSAMISNDTCELLSDPTISEGVRFLSSKLSPVQQELLVSLLSYAEALGARAGVRELAGELAGSVQP